MSVSLGRNSLVNTLKWKVAKATCVRDLPCIVKPEVSMQIIYNDRGVVRPCKGNCHAL